MPVLQIRVSLQKYLTNEYKKTYLIHFISNMKIIIQKVVPSGFIYVSLYIGTKMC